jgi:hypothetical protein
VLLGFTAAVAGAGVANAAGNDPPKKGDTADGIEVFQRDVFVVVGSSLRNPDDSTAADASLFNDAGVSLGLTWGQFEAATATSTMVVHGNHTDGDITLTGLVPNGVYSVFYGTLEPDSENSLCPHVERALPFTSTKPHQQPDSSSFVAGPDGAATFSGRVSGDPLDALQVFIEIVYHLDGQTYGSLPNRGEWLTQNEAMCRSSFGEDAMRQLLILQKFS